MKKSNLFLVSLLTTIMFVGCSNNEYLITEDGIGVVSFNSTVSQLMKHFENVNIENPKEYGMINNTRFSIDLSNGAEEPEVMLSGTLLGKDVKIWRILTYSPKYKTKEGMYVGLSIESIDIEKLKSDGWVMLDGESSSLLKSYKTTNIVITFDEYGEVASILIELDEDRGSEISMSAETFFAEPKKKEKENKSDSQSASQNDNNKSSSPKNNIITITMKAQTRGSYGERFEYKEGNRGCLAGCRQYLITDIITVPKGKYWILKSATTKQGTSISAPDLWDYTYRSENDCLKRKYEGHFDLSDIKNKSLILTAGRKFRLAMYTGRFAETEYNMEVQFIEMDE